MFLLVFLVFLASFRNSLERPSASECGQAPQSQVLSPTEEKVFETLKIDTTKLNEFVPPSDVPKESLLAIMEAKTSRQPNFPWMVAIYRGTEFQCAGSLIDRRHVLSTAHCFYGISDISVFSVKVGKLDVYGGISFAVTQIKIHEDYVRGKFYSDISILTLESEIVTPLISPICLPDEAIAAMDLTGKQATLLGWNFFDFSDGTLGLDIVNATVISNTKCSETYPQSVHKNALHQGITADIICAVTPASGKDVFCKPYSGGPLMYRNNYLNLPDNDPNIPWVLVGVAAFCRRPGEPEGFTRVSTFVDWIKKNV